MQKIFDFRSGTYVFVDDDDVVQEPTNIIRPRIKQIKCLTCKRHEAEGSRPGLCVNCCADIPATLAHVYHMAEAARERAEALGMAWDTAQSQADTATQARFLAYHESTDKQAKATAEQAARRGVIGPLAGLIRLWLDYRDADVKRLETEAWVKTCEAVLR